MNEEDDLLFSVRPSPPHSPRQNDPNPYLIEEATEQKSFLFQFHLQEGVRKEFNMNVETSQSIQQIKTRLADMQEVKDQQFNSENVVIYLKGREL